MPEKVIGTYDSPLAKLPEELRPFVRSLLMTRMAAHFEQSHDGPQSSKAWFASSEFLEQDLKQDPDGAFTRAVFMVTLPKSNDPDAEWYQRWLRGNGLTTLQNESMRDPLIKLLDNPQKGSALTEILGELLVTDVSGLDKAGLADNPEAFSLLATLLVCSNFWTREMSEAREKLFAQALKRFLDSETDRVMVYFGEIRDTREMYERYKRDREWHIY